MAWLNQFVSERIGENLLITVKGIFLRKIGVKCRITYVFKIVEIGMKKLCEAMAWGKMLRVIVVRAITMRLRTMADLYG